MEESGKRALGETDGALLGGEHGGKFHGPIAAAKRGDGVMIRSGAGIFVSGAVVEMELQLAEGRFGDYNRIFRKSDLGSGIRAGFGDEDAVPVCAAGSDVVDIQDQMREALVEDARLNCEGNLGSNESGLDVAAGAEGERGEPSGHHEGEQRADYRESAHRNKDAAAADAQGSECDDFAVHGHAAETEKHANEHGHGDGEDEYAGDDTEE